MRLLILCPTETWHSRVLDAAGDGCHVTSCTSVADALLAHRVGGADAIVVEWSAFSDFELRAFGTNPPACLALLDDPATVETALEKGASDCFLGSDVAMLRLRLRILASTCRDTQELRARANALELIVSSAESAWRFWEYDLSARRFTRVLPEGASARRHSSTTLAESDWQDLYPPHSRSLVAKTLTEELAHHAATGEIRSRQIDVEINNADGSRGFRRIVTRLALDARGRPTLWQGVSWDTTELKSAESVLEASERELVRLLSFLPLPVITLDEQGVVLSWNGAAEKTFGYSREEAMGRRYPLVDEGILVDELRTMQPGGSQENVRLDGYETIRRRKDGSQLDVAVWTSPVLDRNGKVTATIAVFADVTEKKGAELDYKRLFDGAHDAILIFEPEDEIIVDINARGCEMYGRPRGDLVGRSLATVSADPQRGRRKVRETVESGSLLQFETVQYRGDGTAMHLDVNASVIEYRGKPAILSINRDISDRKTHEQELRTRDRALNEARKLDAVGRLAGGIAHDFNNLLMIIESCTEQLVDQLDEEAAQAEEVLDLEDAVERAKTLVGQLLTFGRRIDVEARPVKLTDVIRPLLGLVRRLVGEDIELLTHLDDQVPPIRADSSQLEQVLINLLVNARDAIRGVGTIAISVQGSKNPGFVELMVRDDGVGMDDETREKIFEPFFTTKELGKGTGLGLSTVHGIVTTFGGSIEVKSRVGGGTEFLLLFPATDEPPIDSNAKRRARRSQPGSEAILLVEDERAVRRILSRELRKLGYEVFESEDGVAAMEMAASHDGPIDMLVTDVVMPRMGGEELAKRLCAIRPEMKVVFMSGHMARASVEAIASSGLGPVLAKPFAPARLMATVRAILSPQEA